MEIRRIWQLANIGEPALIIKEDKYLWKYPEDLEELLEPDSSIRRETPPGYNVFITSYYHRINTVIYFCRRV